MKRPDGGNPGRAINLFGVGKDGFKDDPGDPPATQLDAAIFNNLVESLCVLVENSGQILDGLNFNQVWLAVTNAVLTDPTIANGGTLTLEDASQLIVEINSAIVLQSGGALQLQSGGVFQSVIGAIVQLLGSNTFGTTAAQTMTVNSLAEFNENVTLAAATDLTLAADGKVTAGTVDTIDASGDVLTGTVQFYPATPLFGLGVLVFDGHALTLGNGTAAPRIARPVLSYVAGPVVTNAGILDTGASVSLAMTIGEKAKIVATASIKSDALGATINFRAEDGAGIIGNADSYNENAAVAGVSQTATRIIEYTSTINGNVTFKARFGANGGNNTTVNDVSIEASYI